MPRTSCAEETHAERSTSSTRSVVTDDSFVYDHKSIFPNDSPTRSAWQSPPSKYAEYRSSDTLPEHTQVCIIGTGLSGISTAHHLLTTDPKIAVVLLEARTFCSAATGRNGGHLTCDLYLSAPALLKAGFTPSQVRQHAQFEIDNFNALTELIHKENIACEYTPKKRYEICYSQEEFTDALEGVEAMRTCGDELPTVKVWQNPEASQLSGVQCEGLIEHSYAASISPYKLVSGIMDKLMSKHGDRIQLFTQTRVTEISDTRVRTSRGSMSCDNLVFATNGYTAALLPTFKNIIVPVLGQVMTRPFENHMQNCSFAMGGDYLSQRPSGNVVFGGARRFARNMEIGNADDSTISAVVSTKLHTFLDRLQGGPTTTTKMDETNKVSGEEMEWSGVMGYSKLGIPSVLQLPPSPNSNSEGLSGAQRRFICAGFTGHGMPRIFLSARHIAQLILKKSGGEELSSGSGSGGGVPYGYDFMAEMTQRDMDDH